MVVLLLVVPGDHGLIDLQVYRFGVQAWSSGRDVYGQLPATSAGVSLPYLYPPSSLVMFVPLAVVPWELSMVLMTALSLAALSMSVYLVMGRVWSAGGGGEVAVLTAAAVPVLLVLEPVRQTLSFGQINLWLMALVVFDTLTRTPWWPRGVLVGLAIAIKLTPAVFVLFFLLRKDVRAVAVTGVSTVTYVLLGFVFAWHDSVRYWFTGAGPTAGVHGSSFATNQALAGALTRLGVVPPWELLVWAAVTGAVVGVCVLVIPRVDAPTAVVLTATGALVISPTSWSHHWVWIVPALIVCGAHARRRHFSAVVPVAVLATLFAVFLAGPHHLPNSRNRELDWTWSQHLYGNAYLLVALTALLYATWRLWSTPAPTPPMVGERGRGCTAGLTERRRWSGHD